MKEHGQAAYRVGQVRRWLFTRRAQNLAEMTDLPQVLRDELAAGFSIWNSSIARHTQSDDGTEKLLLTLADGGQFECVLLRDNHSIKPRPVAAQYSRCTICISTQVGCGMGCVFCASGLEGLARNLTTGEIIEQMLRLQLLLGPEERLSHIVVMGMGEPLANLDALLPALDQATRADGLGISARRITISTVGLTKAMQRLAETTPRYRLAVSLHAPNDRLRQQIVPIADKIPLTDVLAEADNYFERSGAELTFEYVLLAGINDSAAHAAELANLLAGRTAMLNIIPYNPVAGLPYTTPSHAAQRGVSPNSGIARPKRSLPPSQGRRDRCCLRSTPQTLAKFEQVARVDRREFTVRWGVASLHPRHPRMIAANAALPQRKLIEPDLFQWRVR